MIAKRSRARTEKPSSNVNLDFATSVDGGPRPSPESLRRSPRVVFCGRTPRNLSALQIEFLDSLNPDRLPNIDKRQTSNYELVKYAFYGRDEFAHPDDVLSKPELSPAPISSRDRARNWGKGLLSLFGKDENPDLPSQPDTIPAVVVAFPEIRWYQQPGATTIDTPYELIEELCNSYDVPFFPIEQLRTRDQLQQWQDRIFGQSTELPPATQD